jgi:hypothetical protein
MSQEKYLYRLTTPMGRVSYHEGIGDRVYWPDSLVRNTWFWRLISPLFDEWSEWTYLKIDRKNISSVNNHWNPCFYWPASKLLTNRK